MSKAKCYIPQDRPTFNYLKGTLLYLFLMPLFLAVATLAKKGFVQEGLYNKDTFTKAPKVSYKMIAGYLLGGATFFTAWVTGSHDFLTSTFLAIITTIGFYLFYGFDPKVDKFKNLGDVSSEFVLETLKVAREKLSHIKDISLYEKLGIAGAKAENIIQTIQEDPKDVRVSRKFLTVYIDGVAKVADSYTALEEATINPETKKTTRTHR